MMALVSDVATLPSAKPRRTLCSCENCGTRHAAGSMHT
jgi:hypothetical protein